MRYYRHTGIDLEHFSNYNYKKQSKRMLLEEEFSMHMERIEDENTITFDVHGSLTGTPQSAAHFFETINLALEKCDKEIVADARNVMFIDSMAIGMLAGMLLKCNEKKVSARLVNVPEQIKNVLLSTNLDKVFPHMFDKDEE